MKLDRPLVIVDLETTGLDTAVDRICQFGFCKWLPSGEFTAKARLVNPLMPIPPSATKIHGITDEKVAGEPTFRQLSKGILSLLANSDIGGYNVARFDIELLWEEFYRAGITWDYRSHRVVDALSIWRQMMPRKLIDAAREFCPDHLVSEDLLHDAAYDVTTVGNVIQGQMDRWPELSIDKAAAIDKRTVVIDDEEMETMDLAGSLAVRSDGVVVYTHKKVRGVPVMQDRKYGGWMLHNDGFSMNTKIHLRAAMGLEVPANPNAIVDPPNG